MVLKEDLERVRVLRLAHPPANLLGMGLLRALRQEVETAAEDPKVRCLVLASAYPRYFSTGLDLAELDALGPGRHGELFETLLGTYQALKDAPKPTLAAIGGSAILGGWILAMACDFRLMARETGKFSLAEVRMGLSPGAALIRRLRDISSSPTLVKELVLRGKTLRAEDALAGGFVDRLVPAAELEAEALREAKALAKGPSGAYAAVKRALLGPEAPEEERLLAASREEVSRLLGEAEGLEGVAAMREKRRPRWEE